MASASVCVLTVLACALVCGVLCADSDPSYDHQTVTYKSQFLPVNVHGGATVVQVAPFFSPDHSIDTYVYLINNATTTVDISAPGFSSWSGCTSYEEGCVGCTVDAQRAEAFPVWPALLNAVHRGVKVRLLTNDYKTPTCVGKIAPLDWLVMNGVQVRYYTSTTFTHTKYISTDGKRTAISSVNFSQTSFMKNREAGVILGDGASALIAMATAVFESDWAAGNGYYYNLQQYTDAELAQILSTAAYPVHIPSSPNFPKAYVTPAPAFAHDVSNVTVYASPDYAQVTLLDELHTATTSLNVMIYQITDPTLCQLMIALHSKLALRLLVSSQIYDYDDWKAAQTCYTQLYAAGIRPRKTPSYYTYSHQKFAVVDGVRVILSTGNFSPSDYPAGSAFPPYGQPGWQSVNRDYTVHVTSPTLATEFQTVIDKDWANGSDWTPRAGVKLMVDGEELQMMA